MPHAQACSHIQNGLASHLPAEKVGNRAKLRAVALGVVVELVKRDSKELHVKWDAKLLYTLAPRRCFRQGPLFHAVQNLGLTLRRHGDEEDLAALLWLRNVHGLIGILLT